MTDGTPNSPISEWGISKTHPFLVQDLEDGLAGVTDPELGFSVLELGLVRDVSISEDKAKVLMILTTPFCPYGPVLLEQTREMTEKMLNMPTTIEMGSQVWDPTMMEPGLMDDDWGLLP